MINLEYIELKGEKYPIAFNINTIDKEIPIDMCAIYLRDLIEKMNEITGENVTEDIINKIFSKFCLGK